MKKTILMIATAAAAALSLSFVAGNKVSAATAGTQDSTAKIELTKPTDGQGNDLGLTLNSAPSYDFGPQKIDASGEETYDATTTTGNLSVTNPGLATGWSVSVAAGTFVGDNGVNLKGATIQLDAGKASGVVELPSTSAAKLSAADGTASQPVISADKNAAGDAYQGVGTTIDDITAHLTVPAGNVAGTYTSQLTWTLDDTPTGSANLD
jgi:hypothetical protein